MENFHTYIYGQEIHLCTDHSALTRLMCFKVLQGQTARWIQRLQEYNFTSDHRQAGKHKNSDELSRRLCREECTHWHRVEAWVDVKQIRTTETVAATALESSDSENRTEQPGHRNHSGENTDRTPPRMERNRRPQPDVQKLLCPMEIPRCEERHTKAPLGIRRRTI
jgi:hypothetical protein